MERENSRWEVTVPFRSDLSLGKSLSATQNLISGPVLIHDPVRLETVQINETNAHFKIVSSITDLCDILQIPLAYALKVKTGFFKNEMVTACLKDIDKSDAIVIIFRISFLQQTQKLPQNTELNQSLIHPSFHEDQQLSPSQDALEAYIRSKKKPTFAATHWVKALEVGNELFVLCRISSSTSDDDKLFKIHEDLLGCLKTQKGTLETDNIKALEKFASRINVKMKKKEYKYIKLHIEFFFQKDQHLYSANLPHMVKTIKDFMEKCKGWVEQYKQRQHFVFEEMPASGFLQRDRHGSSNISSELAFKSGSLMISFSRQQDIHYLRAVIRSIECDNLVMKPSEERQYIKHYDEGLQCLYRCFIRNEKAISKAQKYLNLRSNRFISEECLKEGAKVLSHLHKVEEELAETIARLDFRSVLAEDELDRFSGLNSLKLIDKLIETETKLPDGTDLNFLLIGKTGHGKSATGNSILGQETFEVSGSSQSITQRTGVGYGEIDGRTFKVVDTPGVCDTKAHLNQSSADMAIQGICEAIAQCPEGFHAILIVIRYGQRMTEEEEKAVRLLKGILGDDGLKTHGVCIVTNGDNFCREMKGRQNFEAWCRAESGFLKELFEECQYRCVLFNNISEVSQECKHQLISLVVQVDGMMNMGIPFTNEIFKIALRELRTIEEEVKAPELCEYILRNLQFLLDHLKKMIQGENNSETHFLNLKCMVNTLHSQLQRFDGSQVEEFKENLFSLTRKIDDKIEQMFAKQAEELDSEILVSADLKIKPTIQVEKEIKDPLSTHTLNMYYKFLKEEQRRMNNKRNRILQKVIHKLILYIKKTVPMCFPSESWVILKDGSRMAMKDLKVGDEILVRNAEGALKYEKVYMFGHHDVKAINDFLVLQTRHQHLMVSSDHLVYCIKNGREMCVPARLINTDDELITVTCDKLVTQPVLHISSQIQQGIYAPFTFSGTLIVDGALVSCYVDVMAPSKAHKWLWPIRKLYRFCPTALPLINGSKTGNTMPTWAKLYLKWKKLY